MAYTDPPLFIADDYGFATFNTYLRDNLLAMGEAQRHIWIDPTEHRDETVGGWAIATDVTGDNDPYGFGLTHAGVGDYVGFKEYLTPGSWKLQIHTAQRNDYGMFKVDVLSPTAEAVGIQQVDPINTLLKQAEGDAGFDFPGQVGEFNMYDPSATAIFTVPHPIEFTVDQAGLYTIRFTVKTKDINSAGNTVRLFGIGLQKIHDLESSPVVWQPPRTWESGQAMSAAQMETYIRDALRMAGPFRKRTRIDVFSVAGQSGSSLNVAADVPLGQQRTLDTQNEWMEWDVVLPAGDISIIVCGSRGTDHGIATVAWDGVDRGTTDFYNGSAGVNYRGAAITFTNATPKKAKLRITNATKNAASSAYVLNIHCVYIGFDNSAWVEPGHFPARDLVSVAEMNNYWRTPMRMRAEAPWIIDIDPLTCAPTVGNDWWSYRKDDSTTYFVGRLNSDGTEYPGSAGFWVEWELVLAAGTYECSVIAEQGANAGMIDILLDDVEVVSDADFYHASNVVSKVVTTAGIVVATTKVYRVRARVNAKNASSTAYWASINRIRFRRTA